MVEPTTKLLNILYACANGRLPWWAPDDTGEWRTSLPLCDGLIDDETGDEYEGYVLCCGHTLNAQGEAPAIVGAGLMLPGKPDRFGRPTLTITKAGRMFLNQHRDKVEHAMQELADQAQELNMGYGSDKPQVVHVTEAQFRAAYDAWREALVGELYI